MRLLNGFNKVIIELRVVQFWSEISNRTRAARSFDFEITRVISDQITITYNQRERPHHRKQICCVSQGDTFAEKE